MSELINIKWRTRIPLEFFIWVVALTLLTSAYRLSVANDDLQTPSGDSSKPEAIAKKGLHNVYRINSKLLSGSSPDGETGFQSLKEVGVKTIISVDGANPDAATAKKFEMRYVHLPIGYDGISRTQVLRLAKAVQDLPGPIYIHCHHGKHRGPAAIAAIRLCLEESCTVETVLDAMKLAGTDPRYRGLYDVPRKLIRPTQEELDKVPAEFPELAIVSDLAQLMVEIDARWENLNLIQAAGWMSAKDKPDLDSPHEALMLVEQYQEAGRLPKIHERTDQFRDMLINAEGLAIQLEKALRVAKETGKMDRAGADELFQRAKTSCVQCHEKYRDVPQGK